MANKVVIPVKVAVRCRPFSEKEKAEGSQNCVEFYVEHNQLAVGEKMFAYDFVFDQTTSQDDVYEQCALPLLESMRGLTRLSSLRSDKPALRYHATIFAYGQTGSGKTHTMGTEVVADTMTDQQRGIVSRIVQAIFDRIAAQTTDQVKYTASCSMLEIYEDRVIDLLSGSKTDNLPIREADGKVFVQGLSNHAIADLRSTIGKLKIGCENRSKGGTAMNLHSSRSHAIFTITVNQTVDGVDDKTNWIAKLNLVDLAGSENLKKTKAAGERKKEDSLGGSSYTLMIACISPADTNCGETLSTLRYAERAKRIKNKPIVNQDPQAAQILNLKREVAELKRRCTSLEHENDEKQMKMIEERMDLTQQLATFECRRDQSIDVVKAIESKLKPYLSEQPECNGCDDKVITIKSVHAELPKIFEEHEQDDQEQTTAQMMTTTSAADDESTDEEDDATATKEHKTNWVERTSALTTDLQSILTDIRCKEQLAEDMTNAYERQEQLSATRQKEVTELQQQVDRLQSERDELDRQLRTISNQQKSDKMIFCDVCDRGYHTFCVGRWVCTTFCAAEQPPPSAAEKLKTEGGGDSGRSTPVGDPIGTCESCQCTITKVNKVHHRSKYRNDGICTSCARQKQANREPPSRPVEPPEKVKKVDDTADGDDEENQDQKPPAVMEPTMSESTKSVVALAVTTALPTTTTATTTAVTVNQNTAATTTPTTIGGATTTTTTANPVPKPMEMPATQSTHKMPGAASRPSDDVDMASIDDVIGTVISSGVRLPDQVN